MQNWKKTVREHFDYRTWATDFTFLAGPSGPVGLLAPVAIPRLAVLASCENNDVMSDRPDDPEPDVNPLAKSIVDRATG